MALRPPPDVVLVVGGGPLHPAAVARATSARLVVAADSGVDHALAAGLPVHHVVGDLDSASDAAVAKAEAAGATIHRHRADKDATDSELALDLALDLACSSEDGARPPYLLVVGGGLGRLDHLLADISQLVSPRAAAADVTAVLGPATCTIVRPGRPRALVAERGEQVSLLTPAGPARGVTTSGLRWPLHDADLEAGSTRGVSNELLDPAATVAVSDGVVLVVQPGARAPEVPARTTRYDPSPRRAAGGSP